MSWLDLHMHTTFSADGEFSPEELLSLCRKNGVKVAAIADHNCVKGIGRAADYAQSEGITLIPAIEIDCTCLNTDLHLLGYWIDPMDPLFDPIEQNVLVQENEASAKRIQLVQELGIRLDAEEVQRHAIQGMVTGELIAEFALNDAQNDHLPILAPYRPGGERSDNPYVNFYWDYCSKGKHAHVAIQYPSLTEAVQSVHRAGGIAVLAHPGNNIHENIPLLNEIIGQGVCGIEAYSSYHSPEQTAFYLEQADHLGLAVSCGSDFHGKTKPAIQVGSVDCKGKEAELLFRLEQKRQSL